MKRSRSSCSCAPPGTAGIPRAVFSPSAMRAGRPRSRGLFPLFGIGLILRQRCFEGGMRERMRFDARERWIERKIEFDAAGIRKLRNEANVGERRRLAVTICAG